jgi:hypothetical protein
VKRERERDEKNFSLFFIQMRRRITIEKCEGRVDGMKK